MKSKLTILIPSALLLLVGCSMPEHKDAVAFGTGTQIGLKIGVDETRVPTISVGYNRGEAVYLPYKTNDDSNAAAPNPEVPLFTKNSAANARLMLIVRDELASALGKLEGEAPNLISAGEKLSLAKEVLSRIPNDEIKSATLAQVKQQIEDLNIPAEINQFNQSKAVTLTALRANQRILTEFLEKGPSLDAWAGPGYYQGLMIKEGDKVTMIDSYSVLASISAGMDTGNQSKRPSHEGKGNNPIPDSPSLQAQVGQFFATGLAARILAEQGGAALFNPSATAPSQNELALTQARTQLLEADTARLQQARAVVQTLELEAYIISLLPGMDEQKRKAFLSAVMPQAFANFTTWGDQAAIESRIKRRGGAELDGKTKEDIDKHKP